MKRRSRAILKDLAFVALQWHVVGLCSIDAAKEFSSRSSKKKKFQTFQGCVESFRSLLAGLGR